MTHHPTQEVSTVEMPDPVPPPDDIVLGAEALDDVANMLDHLAGQGALETLDRLALAELLHRLDLARSTINGIASEAARLLADLMEQDREEVGRFLVRRSRSRRETWDGEGARSAALVAIRQRLATDPQSGEVIAPLARVVTDAVTLAYSVTSTAPKAKLLTGGLKALNVRVDDYRQVTEDGPWQVEMTEVGDVG